MSHLLVVAVVGGRVKVRGMLGLAQPGERLDSRVEVRLCGSERDELRRSVAAPTLRVVGASFVGERLTAPAVFGRGFFTPVGHSAHLAVCEEPVAGRRSARASWERPRREPGGARGAKWRSEALESGANSLSRSRSGLEWCERLMVAVEVVP